MPPPLIAAGVSAAASVGGALISSSATKKAAKAQTQAADAQIAAARENRDFQYDLNLPTINQGATASGNYNALLGLGGDKAGAEQALGTFRQATGYQDLIREGLGAVNSNAYARGMGDSGATLKALQDRGSTIANGSFQQYLGNLNTVAGRGDQARGLVSGIGLNTTNMINGATQSAADGRSNAALANGANQTGLIQSLLNAGSYAYGSSYGNNNMSPGAGMTGATPPYFPSAQPSYPGIFNPGYA